MKEPFHLEKYQILTNQYTPFCMIVFSMLMYTHIQTYTNGQMYEQMMLMMMAAKSGTYEPENYSTTSIHVTSYNYNNYMENKKKRVRKLYFIICFYILLFFKQTIRYNVCRHLNELINIFVTLTISQVELAVPFWQNLLEKPNV